MALYGRHLHMYYMDQASYSDIITANIISKSLAQWIVLSMEW